LTFSFFRDSASQLLNIFTKKNMHNYNINWWREMVKKYLDSKHKEFPSLYKNFKPGERVVRSYKNESGEIEEYEGIIMAMDPDYMEIYWDTIDGEYNPDLIMDDFTLCDAKEVYDGNQEYSPIKHKKKRIVDYLESV
jgi:hypothetical protein